MAKEGKGEKKAGKRKSLKKDRGKGKKRKKKSKKSTTFDLFKTMMHPDVTPPEVPQEVPVPEEPPPPAIVNIPPIHNYLINLSSLSADEEKILETILTKDAYFERSIDEKVSVLRNEIKMFRSLELAAREDCDLFANRRRCIRCTHTLGFLRTMFTYVYRMPRCHRCKFYICKGCRQKEVNGLWICSVCLRYREIQNLTGEWAYRNCPGISGSDLLRASLREKPEIPEIFVPEPAPPPMEEAPKPEPEIKKRSSKKGKKKKSKGKGIKGKGKGKKDKGGESADKKGKKKDKKRKSKAKKGKDKNTNEREGNVNVSHTTIQNRECRDEEYKDQEEEDSDNEDADESRSESSGSRCSQDSLPVGASAAFERKLREHQTNNLSSGCFPEPLDASQMLRNWPGEMRGYCNETDSVGSNYSNVIKWIEHSHSKGNSAAKPDIDAASDSKQHYLDTCTLNYRNNTRSTSHKKNNENKTTVAHLNEPAGSGALLSCSSLREQTQTEASEESSRNQDGIGASADTWAHKSRINQETCCKATNKSFKNGRFHFRASIETSKYQTDTSSSSNTEHSRCLDTMYRNTARKLNVRHAGTNKIEEFSNNLKRNASTLHQEGTSSQSETSGDMMSSSSQGMNWNKEETPNAKTNTLLMESYYCQQIMAQSNVINSESTTRKGGKEVVGKETGSFLLRNFSRIKVVRKMRCLAAYFLNTNDSATPAPIEIGQNRTRDKNRNFHLERSEAPNKHPEIFTAKYSRKPLPQNVKKKRYAAKAADKGKKPAPDARYEKLHNMRQTIMQTKLDRDVQEKKKSGEQSQGELRSAIKAFYVPRFSHSQTQTDERTRHRSCYPCSFCRFYCDYGSAY